MRVNVNTLPLHLQVVAWHRSWQHFVLDREGEEQADYVLVDDLADCETPLILYKDKEEILSDLSCIVTSLLKNSPWDDYITRSTLMRLKQSEMFIKNTNKMDAAGENKDFSRKKQAPWIKTLLDDEYENFLLWRASFNRTLPVTESKEIFFDKDLSKSRSQIEQYIVEIENRVKRFLPFIPPLKYKIHVKERLSAPLIMKVTTSPGNVSELVINHEMMVASPMSENALLSVLAHEIGGHVGHFSVLRENKFLQNKAPHLLCISMHNQDHFWVEGIAQLIEMLLLSFSDNASVRLPIDDFFARSALLSRNIPSLISNKISIKEAISYHQKHIPSSAEKLNLYYRSFLSDDVMSTQIQNYFHSFKVVLSILLRKAKVDTSELKQLLESFQTPESLQSF